MSILKGSENLKECNRSNINTVTVEWANK